MDSGSTARRILGTRSYPFAFWLLLAATAFPIRVDFPLGPFKTASILDLALAIATLYVLAQFLCMSPIRTGPTALALSVLTPPFIAILSIAWAADTTHAVASAIKYAYGAVLYFIALQAGWRMPRQGMSAAIPAILMCWLVGSLAMYLGMRGFEYFLPGDVNLSQSEVLDLFASVYTRLGHPYLGQSNDYGPLLAVLAFILFGLGRMERSRILTAFSFVAFCASALTFSRGLALGLLVGLFAYAMLSRASMKYLLLVGLVVASASLVFALVIRGHSIDLEDRELQFADIVASRLSEVNILTRLEGYAQTLRQVADRPLLGYGVGYYDRGDPNGQVAVHNALLEQWKYFGVLLGSLVFFCYVSVALYFFRRGKRVPEMAPLFFAISCAWLCLLTASMVETFFEATVPRAMIYLVLGLCVGQYDVGIAPRRDRLITLPT
jgi:O-antigen ligase